MSNTSKILVPDTSVEILFNDPDGLVDSFKDIDGYGLKYNPQSSRASHKSREWIVIGSAISLARIKYVLSETLRIYGNIKYYSVSNDYFRTEFWRQHEVTIGSSTKPARERGIKPIKSNEMLEALENFSSTEELLAFIRSRYTGEFKTFEIKPITVTSYFSADHGSVDPPSLSKKLVYGRESTIGNSPPTTYTLLASMLKIDVLTDFQKQLEDDVWPMLQEWKRNRGEKAKEFGIAVTANKALHKDMSDVAKQIYYNDSSPLNSLNISNYFFKASNRENNPITHYVFIRENPAQPKLQIYLHNVNSLSDFEDQLENTEEILGEWVEHHSASDKEFHLTVIAKGEIQQDVSEAINQIYSDESPLGKLLKKTSMTMDIHNKPRSKKINYEIKREKGKFSGFGKVLNFLKGTSSK